jgi:hypothetical protein
MKVHSNEVYSENFDSGCFKKEFKIELQVCIPLLNNFDLCNEDLGHPFSSLGWMELVSA